MKCKLGDISVLHRKSYAHAVKNTWTGRAKSCCSATRKLATRYGARRRRMPHALFFIPYNQRTVDTTRIFQVRTSIGRIVTTLSESESLRCCCASFIALGTPTSADPLADAGGA